MSTILTATGLTMRFGGLTAVTEFDADIPQGSIISRSTNWANLEM